MDRLDIKQKLERLGTSPYSIAKRLGVEAPAVYGVLRGYTKSKKIESALVKLLNMPIEDIQRAYSKKYKPPITAA